MTNERFNGRGVEPPGASCICDAGATGEAAILLVESLIHGLIARSIVSVEDALDIVATAKDVCAEFIEVGNDRIKFEKSLTILQNISSSLLHDIQDP